MKLCVFCLPRTMRFVDSAHPTNDMTIRTTVFILLSFVFYLPAQADDSLNEFTEAARAEFVSVLHGKYDNFELCEAFSKSDDKKAFLNRVFSTQMFSGATLVKSSELFASHENAKSRLHLGVIALSFTNPGEAEKIYHHVAALNQDYFDKTKILTKYRAYRIGRNIVFVYSETFLKDELKRLFAQIDGVFLGGGK